MVKPNIGSPVFVCYVAQAPDGFTVLYIFASFARHAGRPNQDCSDGTSGDDIKINGSPRMHNNLMISILSMK